MSKRPFSLLPPPSPSSVSLSFFSCSSLTGTICQRRGYLRAAKRTKREKKEKEREKEREREREREREKEREARKNCAGAADLFRALILYPSAQQHAIDLNFLPRNDVTFSFGNLPRNYDGSREQPSLIAPIQTKRAPGQSREYYFQFAASTYAHLYLLDEGGGGRRREEGGRRLIAQIHPEVEPALYKAHAVQCCSTRRASWIPFFSKRSKTQFPTLHSGL